jgi:hypothetical protein
MWFVLVGIAIERLELVRLQMPGQGTAGLALGLLTLGLSSEKGKNLV